MLSVNIYDPHYRIIQLHYALILEVANPTPDPHEFSTRSKSNLIQNHKYSPFSELGSSWKSFLPKFINYNAGSSIRFGLLLSELIAQPLLFGSLWSSGLWWQPHIFNYPALLSLCWCLKIFLTFSFFPNWIAAHVNYHKGTKKTGHGSSYSGAWY